MQKNSVNKMVVDLSNKSTDEIAEFLNILLSVRYSLLVKGIQINIIKKTKTQRSKISPN